MSHNRSGKNGGSRRGHYRRRREALTLFPLDHPGLSTSLDNIANAVFTRYERSSSMEDLEEVIMYRREALSLHHPDCSQSLNGITSAVLTRYVQSGRAKYLEESFMLYEKAVNHLAASVKSRSNAAIEWAGAAHDNIKGTQSAQSFPTDW